MSETQTVTLTEFLLARITEKERWARAAIDNGYGWRLFVLAECEAKRRVLEALEIAVDENTRGGFRANQIFGLLQAIHILATPYADHPDYDEAWKS